MGIIEILCSGGLLLLGLFGYERFKRKNAEADLEQAATKEKDAVLRTKMDITNQTIESTKEELTKLNNVEVKEKTPEEIESFWNKK